jgi:hypothetical protein
MTRRVGKQDGDVVQPVRFPGDDRDHGEQGHQKQQAGLLGPALRVEPAADQHGDQHGAETGGDEPLADQDIGNRRQNGGTAQQDQTLPEPDMPDRIDIDRGKLFVHRVRLCHFRHLAMISKPSIYPSGSMAAIRK